MATITVAAVLAAGPATKPSTNPSTKPTTASVVAPTEPKLTVREWAVYVVDATDGKSNPDGMIAPTMPGFVTDHRFGSGSPPADQTAQLNVRIRRRVFVNGRLQTVGPAAGAAEHSDAKQPGPVGVIRLFGSASGKVDVAITAAGSTIMGAWPKPQDRPNEILWRDLDVSPAAVKPFQTVDPTDFFATLRGVDSLPLSTAKNPSEKFLAYDLELPAAKTVHLEHTPDGSYKITNQTPAVLREAMICLGTAEHWQFAPVGDLPPTPAAAPKPAHASVAVAATTAPATTRAATTAPATTTASAATKPAGFTLINGTAKTPGEAWKPGLIALHIPANDAETIGKVIDRYALDDTRPAIIYRMDPAELERLVKLEITPQPGTVERTAIVIVRNADPTAGTVVDELIKHLGDDDWSTRDAAFKALAAMGPATYAKLQPVSKGKDLEAAWRAQRLLAAGGKLQTE